MSDKYERLWEVAMAIFCLFLMIFILAAYVDTRQPPGRPYVQEEK